MPSSRIHGKNSTFPSLIKTQNNRTVSTIQTFNPHNSQGGGEQCKAEAKQKRPPIGSSQNRDKSMLDVGTWRIHGENSIFPTLIKYKTDRTKHSTPTIAKEVVSSTNLKQNKKDYQLGPLKLARKACPTWEYGAKTARKKSWDAKKFENPYVKEIVSDITRSKHIATLNSKLRGRTVNRKIRRRREERRRIEENSRTATNLVSRANDIYLLCLPVCSLSKRSKRGGEETGRIDKNSRTAANLVRRGDDIYLCPRVCSLS